ncbi:MAG: cyclophilin-like fold protein [Gammaproteobacteria bacterium]
MTRKIEIQINEHKIVAELLNTKTAESIFKQLPFKSKAQTWGDEIYFKTPITNQALEENAKDIVQLGELAFWVEGNCIAIGFGPTPISRDNEIRLAARTNIWAYTDYDLGTLKDVQAGDDIILNPV